MATNPLTDLIPAQYRKYAYGVVALAAIVFAAWQGADGNLTVFVGALITALTGALALSNTSTPTQEPLDEGNEFDGHGDV